MTSNNKNNPGIFSRTVDLNKPASSIGGNGENEDLGEKATIHEFWYTPIKLPSMEGAVTYIASGMPSIYLNSPAYSLHRDRSLWMNNKGCLGLLVGGFINIPGGVRWLHGSIIQWTKPGALKKGRKVKIIIRVMLIPAEYRGATAVELNGDICLTYVPGNLQ